MRTESSRQAEKGRRAIKIVHLTSLHSPFDIRIFHKECRSLAKAGFDVTLIAQNERNEVADGVKIKALSAERSRLKRIVVASWQVFKESLRENADIYQFHDPELIPAGLALTLLGKRVVYDAHEDLPNDILLKQYLPAWSRPLLSRIAGGVEALAGRWLKAIVTVSPKIAERFSKYNSRTILVRNYADPDELASSDETPWNGRPNAVAFAGGILPERGIRQMVTAVGLLREPWTATLEIASGEFSADLQAELSRDSGWQRVQYLGKLDRKQIGKLYSRVKAGLVLYLPEAQNMNAMPHKIFEYMAAGLPVIASDFPLWREMLSESNCAVFVDPLQPEKIAQAIEYILSHPEEAQKMGRRGKDAVAISFNWETQAKNLTELYRELMEPLCVA
jgi:glycosyltransferase involved in cell wall biosynthesis